MYYETLWKKVCVAGDDVIRMFVVSRIACIKEECESFGVRV